MKKPKRETLPYGLHHLESSVGHFENFPRGLRTEPRASKLGKLGSGKGPEQLVPGHLGKGAKKAKGSQGIGSSPVLSRSWLPTDLLA